MRQRSRLRDSLEYCAARAVLQSLALTPRPIAFRLARLYARLLDLALPRLRRVALRNLEMALPELTPAGRDTIADGVYRSIARLLVAFARFPQLNRDNISDWIRYDGFENFKSAKDRGKGVLVATAHLGNWELSAFAHAYMFAPMNIV